MREVVVLELEQFRPKLDTSLREHLRSKGELCGCCEQPSGLCRCVKRAEQIRKSFAPKQV